MSQKFQISTPGTNLLSVNFRQISPLNCWYGNINSKWLVLCGSNMEIQHKWLLARAFGLLAKYLFASFAMKSANFKACSFFEQRIYSLADSTSPYLHWAPSWWLRTTTALHSCHLNLAASFQARAPTCLKNLLKFLIFP